METTRSVQFLRKRKFLLMVPLLMLPFLTLGFWALGGGKKVISPSEQTMNAKGFNAELPAAHFKDENQQDKLSLYEKARKDSVQLENSLFSSALEQMGFRNAKEHEDSVSIQAQFDSNGEYRGTDPNEERINKKLAQLSQALQKEPEIPVVKKSEKVFSVYEKDHQDSLGNDVEKLETMMKGMSDHTSEDPEMQQLNAMMEKILDIQHPDRVREEIKSKSLQEKQQVFQVETLDPDVISLLSDIGLGVFVDTLAGSLSSSIAVEQNAFYGLEEKVDSASQSRNVIEAVIHDTQVLTTGATVKIRLQKEVFVNGLLIPKGQLIYGIASIQGDRLHIMIGTLLYHDSILPVALSAYDMDGMEGLYIPGSINKEAAKKGTDDAVQSMQLMPIDASLGAQAAGAGIQAAKGLFSKKSKLAKITVKAGYQLFLRDNNSNL